MQKELWVCIMLWSQASPWEIQIQTHKERGKGCGLLVEPAESRPDGVSPKQLLTAKAESHKSPPWVLYTWKALPDSKGCTIWLSDILCSIFLSSKIIQEAWSSVRTPCQVNIQTIRPMSKDLWLLIHSAWTKTWKRVWKLNSPETMYRNIYPVRLIPKQ